MPKTPGEKGNKLLANAQRVAKGPSGQRSSQFLLEDRESSRYITIRRLEVQLDKRQQFLVANNLIKSAPGVGERPFEERSTRQEDAPRGVQKGN